MSQLFYVKDLYYFPELGKKGLVKCYENWGINCFTVQIKQQ